MRHRKAGFKLGRTRSHRTAMLRNMAASLFEHGQITTTIPKAKALQPFVEKIVTKAKRGDIHARRQVIAMLGADRHAFDWNHLPNSGTAEERAAGEAAVNEIRERAQQFFDIPDTSETERNRYGELRKAPKLVRHIFENVAPRFEDREGGYTRIVKLGVKRLGDAGELCIIQFCGAEEGPEIGGAPSGRRRQADKRTAYWAKIRKGMNESAPAEEAPEEAPAEDDTATAVADAPEAESTDSEETKED